MKRLIITLVFILSFVACLSADDEIDCPQSISEAIKRLDAMLAEEEKAKLAEMKEEDLITLHFGFGMGIRNGFCLWNKTGLTEEMNRILVTHPDNISSELIYIYWRTLNDSKFNLELYLKEKRKDAIETMTKDLHDIRNRIKELEDEKAKLSEVAEEIEELLNKKSKGEDNNSMRITTHGEIK